MPTLLDLTGQRFGRLTVIGRAPTIRKRTRWRVVCDCGTEKIVRAGEMRHNTSRHRTRSCGCFKLEVAGANLKTHGASKTLQYRLFWQAKRRAKQYGLEFNIEPSDIEVPLKCPLLGTILKQGSGLQSPGSPSVDRIDPALGYVKGNVWVISYRANTIKSDATLEELRAIVFALEAKCGI